MSSLRYCEYFLANSSVYTHRESEIKMAIKGQHQTHKVLHHLLSSLNKGSEVAVDHGENSCELRREEKE